MIFTRIALVVGLAVVATMCWLAIDGFKPVVPLLVTAIALVALVGGGSIVGGRSSRGGRAPGAGREAEGPGPK
ncbi:MAG: hypothetical protein ACRDVW_11060 [Acidimicrobiales bacterium]